MQRLFRPFANARAAKSAAQAAARLGPRQTVTVQHVRIRRARNIFRTVLIGGVVTYGCWRLYNSAVINPLLRHMDKELESLSPKERKQLEKELEESDNSMFIALPFTTTVVPSMPYRGTDPEWSRFEKISKDVQLQNRIRNDLADIVRQTVEKHPLVTRRYGRVVSIRKYWLDIDFPYRPAPTFRQLGLLFNDDGIFLATEPVDSLTVFRLQKILWPTAMAQSSWAFTSAMAKQHWLDMKKFLGLQSPPPPPPSAPSRPQSESVARSNLPSAGRQTANGTPAAEAPESSGTVSTTAEARNSDDAKSGGKTSYLKDMAMSHVEGSRQMSSGPWAEFRRKLAQTWKRTRDFPPRGSISVSGFVEIETAKGYVVVDVTSHWDPKTKRHDPNSMSLAFRRAQMKQQRPAPR